MKFLVISIYLFTASNLIGQSFAGLGLDLGIRGVGPKFEIYTLKRIRFETGANFTRFGTFTGNLGIKVALLKATNTHNIWLGSMYKYKNSSTSILEDEDDVIYNYETNELNYFVPKMGYSYRFGSSDDNEKNRITLVELTVQYDFLVGNKPLITPDKKNVQVSSFLENEMMRYFDGGLGVYVSAIFFFRGSK